MKYLLLFLVLVLAVVVSLMWTRLRPIAEESAPEVSAARPTDSGQSTPPARTEPAPSPVPMVAPPLPAAPLPAELAAPAAASRDRIAAAKTPAELAVLHRILSQQLLDRLETLGTNTDPAAVRVAVQELADRFYLVDRVAKVRQWTPPGTGSIDPAQRERIERLLRVWQQNMAMSLTVDQLFRERGLLPDEHIPHSLRRWSQEGPREAP